MTKENTLVETENLMSYLEEVCQSEKILNHPKLIVFGFSQGVSIALRWMARNQVQPHTLALYAGGIPKELKHDHFEYLDYFKINIKSIYGDKDEFLSPERLKTEKVKLDNLFQGNFELITFNGGHEIKSEIITELINP
ncbi:alpha/beta hydrolase [Flagellimonas sp. S174]|uniref:alpha/beta hydrolase n=1 Tax=Flagellimonas sp. S174 TaxID=3410790 RepID=UPI003BF4EB19